MSDVRCIYANVDFNCDEVKFIIAEELGMAMSEMIVMKAIHTLSVNVTEMKNVSHIHCFVFAFARHELKCFCTCQITKPIFQLLLSYAQMIYT